MKACNCDYLKRHWENKCLKNNINKEKTKSWKKIQFFLIAFKDFCKIKKNLLSEFSSSSLLGAVMECSALGTIPLESKLALAQVSTEGCFVVPLLGSLEGIAGMAPAQDSVQPTRQPLLSYCFVPGESCSRYVTYCCLPLASLCTLWWKSFPLIPLPATVNPMQPFFLILHVDTCKIHY